MRFRKIAAALLTLALGFCLCQPAAFAATAADQHTQLQELPVSIQSTGETPLPKETLTVELEAVDNAPLPEVTTLEITDGETGSFGPISYTKPGYYVYTVRQRAGVNTRGTYDETVYYLRVSVVWDNDKLVARMAVHTQPDLMDEKVSSITFNNSYKAIETPYYPDPYDPDPVTPPTPSTPENPAPADARPTVTETTTPSAPEPTAPASVVADARPAEGPKLIQTGQLNWPQSSAWWDAPQRVPPATRIFYARSETGGGRQHTKPPSDSLREPAPTSRSKTTHLPMTTQDRGRSPWHPLRSSPHACPRP